MLHTPTATHLPANPIIWMLKQIFICCFGSVSLHFNAQKVANVWEIGHGAQNGVHIVHTVV